MDKVAKCRAKRASILIHVILAIGRQRPIYLWSLEGGGAKGSKNARIFSQSREREHSRVKCKEFGKDIISVIGNRNLKYLG